MKDRKREIYIGLFICLLLIMAGRIILQYMKKMADTKIVYGKESEYTYYDRELTIEDFLQFDHNTTYEEMVECIGKENGGYGYGGAWPYYELSDGTYAICQCLPKSKIRAIVIVNKKEKLYTLLEANLEDE